MGSIPNGSDLILERATSVHMGPVCYGPVQDRSEQRSCFSSYCTDEAFKLGPKLKFHC